MLKNIDFLGPSIELKIKNESILKSDFGGLSTIMVFFISIGAFFGFGRDLFKRESPSIMFNKVLSNNATFNITDTNFLFAVYDQYTDKSFEELDRKFVGSLDYNQFYGDGNSIKKKIYFEKCSEVALKKWEGNFKNAKDLYYCLPNGTNLKINGIFNEGAYISLRLQYNFCKNNTDVIKGPIKTNCYDREFIEKNITGRIQMHYIMESININTKEYDNPGNFVPFSGVANTNVNTWNRLTIFLKKIEIETDTGFFIEDLRNDIYYGIDSVNVDSVFSQGTDTIFSHLIGNYKYKDVYQRKYIKVQNIFALMGGFINGAAILIRMFLKFVAEPDLIDIFNGIYKFREVSENSAKKKIEAPKIISNDEITSISDSRNNSRFLKNNSLHDSTKIKPEAFIQSWNEKKNINYQFKLTSLQKLCRLCRLNKNKQLIYKQVERKMTKVVSFENFIKITRDAKILSHLLLDCNYIKILEVCPIPRKQKGSDKILFDFESVLQEVKKNDKIFMKAIRFLE